MARYFKTAEQEKTVEKSVNLVASIILQSKGAPILIDSIGDAEICSEYMLYRLCEAGLWAMPFSADAATAVTKSAPEASRGTLLLVNESGMSLLPSCLNAVELGLTVIAITASHDTPLSKLANINVVIKNNKSSILHYEPNYFTAGALAFLERVLAACRGLGQ